MSTERCSVALDVDRAFGGRLLGLARRVHVWIVESPENRAAVHEVLDDVVRNDGFENRATIVSDDGTHSPDEVAADRPSDIELHLGGCSHTPPVSRPWIHGTVRTASWSLALEAMGFWVVAEVAKVLVAEQHPQDAR